MVTGVNAGNQIPLSQIDRNVSSMFPIPEQAPAAIAQLAKERPASRMT